MIKHESNDSNRHSKLQFFQGNIGKIECFLLLIIFIGLFFSISYIKIFNELDQGDSAQFCEMTENIAARGIPYTNIGASVLSFITDHIGTKSPTEICSMPLGSADIKEMNILSGGHPYLILYLIAPLTYFVPANIVLESLTALSFAAFIILIYIILRQKQISIPQSILFCSLIMVHPAWQQSLLGQIYPDRFFLFLGLLFIYIFTEKNKNLYLVFFSGLFVCSLQERAAITIGLFIILYVILYWSLINLSTKQKISLLLMGIIYLILALIFLTFILTNKAFIMAYMPLNLDIYIMRLSNQNFMDMLLIFSFFNLIILGIFALFEFRAFVIAFIMMLPNMLGSIGGAEKIGFITHYHSIYFPILVWAALLGYINLSKKFTKGLKEKLFLIFMLILIIFAAGVDPYKYDKFDFSLNNIKSNGLLQTAAKIPDTIQGNVPAVIKYSNVIKKAVPENSKVTTPEGYMPYLYKNRVLYLFPVGLDSSDYAVLPIIGKNGSENIYGGFFSYIGPEHTTSVNKCLIDRMKNEGYDFENSTIIEPAGVAIIKRIG